MVINIAYKLCLLSGENYNSHESDEVKNVFECIPYYCLCFCCCGSRDDIDQISFHSSFVKKLFRIIVIIIWFPIFSAIGFLIYGLIIVISPFAIIF